MSIDLTKHEENCTPVAPCKTCLVAAHLRNALSPADFDKLVEIIQETKSTPISTLELSVRSDNVLRNNQIFSVEKLITHSESELLRFEYFGRKSLNEIREALERRGLHLAAEKKSA